MVLQVLVDEKLAENAARLGPIFRQELLNIGSPLIHGVGGLSWRLSGCLSGWVGGWVGQAGLWQAAGQLSTPALLACQARHAS